MCGWFFESSSVFFGGLVTAGLVFFLNNGCISKGREHMQRCSEENAQVFLTRDFLKQCNVTIKCWWSWLKKCHLAKADWSNWVMQQKSFVSDSKNRKHASRFDFLGEVQVWTQEDLCVEVEHSHFTGSVQAVLNFSLEVSVLSASCSITWPRLQCCVLKRAVKTGN